MQQIQIEREKDDYIQIYNFPRMSLHSAYLFPKKEFSVVNSNTIGYISDNIFYRLNLETSKSEATLNKKGRSYQAFALNHKRGLVVLADYGKNPNIYFEYMQRKEAFELKDICTLEIDSLCLSLDCKFLLVCCGIPEKKIIVVDVENRKLLKGSHSFVSLDDRKVSRLEFNPSNSKTFAVMYQNEIETYTIDQTFTVSDTMNLEESIKIDRKTSITTLQPNFETFTWDELNNIYASDGKNVFVYSTDTDREVVNYDLEGDFDGQVVANFILTQKHVIIVYCNGRMEWLNKYYPDLMEEQDFSNKPFYLDKYYEFPTIINYATYNHQFSKIFIAHKNGFFSVMNKQAESTQAEDEEEDNKGGIAKSKKEKDKKLDVQISKVGPSHANHIVFCREVKGKALVMTISRAGRIVFWSIPQKKPIAFMETASEVASADVNSNFTILCTSDHGGSLQFYSISDFDNIFLFKEYRLVEKGEINQVLFSSNSQQIACLSSQNKRVFYLLTDEINEIQILGYVTLPYIPVSICWNKTTKTLVKPKFEHLLCCVGFGIIMINGPAATSVQLRAKQFELNCEMFGLRTDLEQKHIEVLASGDIISTGSDRILKKYKQPEDPLSKFNPESKNAAAPPLEQIEAHDLEVTFMKVSNKYFISGGADGTFQIRPLENFNSVKTLNVFGWKNANLFTGATSDNDDLFFACGKDGALCMWKTKQLEIKLSDQPKKEKSKYSKIKSAGNKLQYFEIAIENEYLEKMKDTITKKKRDQLERITRIKSELKQLLAENQTHEELEKLQRDQFVIDIQSRDLMTKKGQQNCEKIKKQSMRKVLYNQVFRNKLKQITWDQIQEHLRAINGIKNNYIVYNYQIRKVSAEEKRTLQIILDLRKNQIKEMKRRGTTHVIDPDFYKNRNIINGGVLQPLILTVLEKKDEKKDEKAKKKKEEEAPEKQPEQTEQIPKDEIWQYLYSSFELFSDNSKRNQILLMKNIIVKIKQAFNREFNKLLKLRQSQNQMINDKNKRIIQICDELKKSHEIIVSKKNILENPDRILEVINKEIPFPRYLSREEREKLEKERLKEEERLRALAEDDSSQRALQKMMGGTLEEKKTSVLEVTVEREKWMDKPIEEMSEQEKNKLKEYEQKKQKAEQEKERIVKKLEAELRKLKLDIDDIMEKYDEKLFTLLRRRIQYDLRIEEQELYCIKLSLSIANYKDESEKQKILDNKLSLYKSKIRNLQNQRDRLQEQEAEIEKAKQAKKAILDVKKLGDHQGKIKTIQKITFEDYLTNIKKRRQIEQNLQKTDLAVQNQIIPLDPMKQIQSKILSNINAQQFKFFIPDKKKFMEENDLSEQLFHLLEVRFNAKKEDAEFERKLRGVRDSVKKLEEEIATEQDNEQADHRMLRNIQSYLEQSKSDLQILFRIKKGFVQIDNQTPVPCLDDALLISKSEIDEKNLSITEKAKLKIGVMTEIKTCKISVTELTLQLDRQQSLINQLSTMIKQVQMLKVKKEMQTALAKKDTKINENQLRSLKEQIEKVRKEGEKRISLFEKKIQKVNQEVESIKKENKQLEIQKWNLENTVKQREKIKDMMVGENGKGNEEAAEKFEQISINRKLFDKAKQQTDEIELLREELSKLKAKTFANFSSVQR